MMRKIKLVLPIIIILTAILSATLGYSVAYCIGLRKMYESHINAHCSVLLVQSTLLIQYIDSSGVNGLIDVIELKGDDVAFKVRTWLPRVRAEDKRIFSTSLERWETAKKKLEELRSSIPDN